MEKRYVHLGRKLTGIILSLALLAFNYTAPMSALRELPGEIAIQSGESYQLPVTLDKMFTAYTQDDVQVSLQGDQKLSDVLKNSGQHEEQTISIRMFGMIPVKEVTVHMREHVSLTPGGSSIGVTLYTKGALVVGVSAIQTAQGEQISPAAAAGIRAGDIIEQVNGEDVRNASHLMQMCNESHESIVLTINRDGETLRTTLRAVLDQSDQKYRMGMWVRDSTAGVGTLSFYDPDTNWYAALGHAITDVDTKSNLTVREGEIVQSSIIDIVQGTQGQPGELRGTFNSNSLALGTIKENSEYGIYGEIYSKYHNALYKNPLAMAYPEEIKAGSAQILTTLNDDGITAYDCRIIKVNPQSYPAPKGMVIEITDEDLLAKTGGIVQGMSGSPIIQNNKLVGVVTHVFINDPTKGYCMYAQWMYEHLKQIAS